MYIYNINEKKKKKKKKNINIRRTELDLHEERMKFFSILRFFFPADPESKRINYSHVSTCLFKVRNKFYVPKHICRPNMFYQGMFLIKFLIDLDGK